MQSIYQFERADGVVANVDVNSKQFAEALNTGMGNYNNYFTLKKIKDLIGKHFIVIIRVGGGGSLFPNRQS